MKIDKSEVKVIFEFSPKDYVLCKCEDKMLGDYTLNPLIDRSNKGKSPDVGCPRIYLTEEEAQICRENGFCEFS